MKHATTEELLARFKMLEKVDIFRLARELKAERCQCGGDLSFQMQTGRAGLYLCQTCGNSGDVVSFVRETLSMDYAESVAYLTEWSERQ